MTKRRRAKPATPAKPRSKTSADLKSENLKLRRELNKAHQQQTATAGVLQVISRSTFDLQTVFDTLVESAARLCDAKQAMIWRQDGESYKLAANYGFSREFEEFCSQNAIFPGRTRGTITGRTVLAGKTVHIPDVLADPEFTESAYQIRGGFRSCLGVPLLREGRPIGVFVLTRPAAKAFTDKQIDLVTNFAAQAVIAIANVRLFNDVKEALDHLRASSEILKVISSSVSDSQPVFDAIVTSCARLFPGCQAGINALDENGRMRLRASVGIDAQALRRMFREIADKHAGGGLLLRGTLAHYPDVEGPDVPLPVREGGRATNTKAVVFAPMVSKHCSIGSLWIARTAVGAFSQKELDLLQSFADQAVIAIHNVQLFDEIQDKSRQLAEASQHKSQFLANMSHELRTPLNAILGYTELILDSVYGDMPEKVRGVLDRVQRNGRHLLGLINDVLDLSKIEAGQLTLSLADYSLKNVIQSVLGAVEPLASDKQIALKIDVAKELPQGHGDERRLTQVLLNLVGNAIKFTDTGEVSVTGCCANGSFTVAVRDTGPGISPADQAKLFQEFAQADNSITRKKGGTGLGLAISRRIIEMHGGRIWVESSPGHGSTFAFTLPVTVAGS